jgi:hypothetical protein
LPLTRVGQGDLVEMVTREQLTVEVGGGTVSLDATVQTHTIMRVAAVTDTNGGRTARLDPTGLRRSPRHKGAPPTGEGPQTGSAFPC